ncbi:helix-turn-helix domain-containing protein [Anaerosinus sp.]
MDQNDYLLGSDEIAKRLGCNRNFVGALINSGLLRALRFGRTRKVRNSTLNEFLKKYEGYDLHELVKKNPCQATG